MKYKVVSLILAVVLSISCALPAMAIKVDAQKLDNTHGTSLVDDSNLVAVSETAVPTKYLWKAAFSAVKWILVKIDGALFDRDPQITDGSNWMATSSGSVSFGNGTGDVRRVKYPTDISISNNKLDVFAQTGILGWLDTITIFIEDSSGQEVYGGQVTHNQHIFTDDDLPLGNYTIYYVDSDNREWDCWLYRFDFTESASRSAMSSDVTASNMVYNPVTQKSYVIPSDISKSGGKIKRSGNILTAQDLVNEFHDDKLNCSVNRMKDYDIGDTIYVTDVITDLQYDAGKDTTTVYFGKTADGSFSWPFAGNLCDQFSVNDVLTFRFTVVEEYAVDEYSFETLDYFMESYGLIADGTAANIEDYLLS